MLLFAAFPCCLASPTQAHNRAHVHVDRLRAGRPLHQPAGPTTPRHNPACYFTARADLKTPYSNYVRGYQALLDLVWYEPDRLAVTGALPVPPPDVLAGYIPSAAFPSDHLAIVYDLALLPLRSAAEAAR